MFKYLLIATLLAVVAATKIEKCSKGQPLPRDVRVQGCSQPPCEVYKGKNAVFDVDFTVPKEANNLQTKVMATAFGITIPYDLPEDVKKSCDHLANGAYCPLDAGEDVTYNFNFPVGKAYPEIRVTLEVSVVDDKSNDMFCFKLDIQVKS